MLDVVGVRWFYESTEIAFPVRERIKTFGPSPGEYRVELRPGLASHGQHVAYSMTIRDMVYELGNLQRCECPACEHAPFEELTLGAMMAARRKNKYGGRQPLQTVCKRCGRVHDTATEARACCRRPTAGRPPVPTACRRCGVECASRVEARDHCRVPRVRRMEAATSATAATA